MPTEPHETQKTDSFRLESPKKDPNNQKKVVSKQHSDFEDLGFKQSINLLEEEIRELYLTDDVPWIIGYSGGKDSTATLQLVWNAVAGLNAKERHKTIHVISTDTLVENPIVSSWVKNSLKNLNDCSKKEMMPFLAKLLYPEIEQSFWVNLIGKGYPAPRPKFRWCTERLKINPSNKYITGIVKLGGEAILCLGARKQESIARKKVFIKNAVYRVKDRLSPSASLPGCLIYTPVENWSNDDIWFYLNNQQNPWGISNKDLMSMYAGASPDGECPLVLDTSTPSCGDSRFGCWVCTLVDKDKSMSAMIQNDVEKEWLLPLLKLRNALDFRNNSNEIEEKSDHHLRDFRRMTASVQLMSERKPVPGPYTEDSRLNWLKMLLEAQVYVREHGPEEVRELELIRLEELQEIRRIWVMDKHELEDHLPKIYESVMGKPYPGEELDDNLQLVESDLKELEELCNGDRMHYELVRELLSRTRQQQNSARRSKLHQELERSFSKHFYDDRDEAIQRAQKRQQERRQKQRQSHVTDGVLEEESVFKQLPLKLQDPSHGSL